ncbi:MAG: hypothetical protein KF753_15445 [Caldilineaceae bacterium]|nr:hypothetical protein [Caldilineaceae bacterium]
MTDSRYSGLDRVRSDFIESDQLAILLANSDSLDNLENAILMCTANIVTLEPAYEDLEPYEKVLLGDLLATFYSRRALWKYKLSLMTKDSRIWPSAYEDAVTATNFPDDHFPNSEFKADMHRLCSKLGWLVAQD